MSGEFSVYPPEKGEPHLGNFACGEQGCCVVLLLGRWASFPENRRLREWKSMVLQGMWLAFRNIKHSLIQAETEKGQTSSVRHLWLLSLIRCFSLALLWANLSSRDRVKADFPLERRFELSLIFFSSDVLTAGCFAGLGFYSENSAVWIKNNKGCY